MRLLKRSKRMVAHGTISLNQQTVRVIADTAGVCNFKLWLQNIWQAYLKSSSTVAQEVYIKPTKVFKLLPGKRVGLLKSLHGLLDSKDYKHQTMRTDLKRDLGAKEMFNDLACYTKIDWEKLRVILAAYVDDTIATRKTVGVQRERGFDRKPCTYNSLTFGGISVRKEESK